MGTWGSNYFENDAAFDYMGDIEAADDPKAIIEGILEKATESDYLEADEAAGAIVAAAYIDKQVNGTSYSGEDMEDALDIDTFVARNPGVDLTPMRANAIKALKKVLGEGSELLELWQENEDDFPAWRQSIEALITRLETGRNNLRAV